MVSEAGADLIGQVEVAISALMDADLRPYALGENVRDHDGAGSRPSVELHRMSFTGGGLDCREPSAGSHPSALNALCHRAGGIR